MGSDSKTLSKKSGGGFFSWFCRPQRPEDTGAVTKFSSDTKTVVASNRKKSRRKGDARSPSSQTQEGSLSPEGPDFIGELESYVFPNDANFFRDTDATEIAFPEDEESEEEEQDPHEAAYRLWYSKGMLSFVPQSLQDEPKEKIQKTKVSLKAAQMKRHVVQRKSSESEWDAFPAPPPPPPVTRVTHQQHRQERQQPQEQRPKESAKVATQGRRYFPATAPDLPAPPAATLTCSCCGKSTASKVRCTECKEVYCSMFCRGNDRYKHAQVCNKDNSNQNLTPPAKKSSPVKLRSPHHSPQRVESATGGTLAEGGGQLHRYWQNRANQSSSPGKVYVS